jgi:hypothetical protein
MTTLKNNISGWKLNVARLMIMSALAFTGCKPDADDQMPYLPFEDIVINLSLPEYFILQSSGTYKYINGGVKGIILYRKSADVFYAFERNCSFSPNDACSTVEVEITGLQISDPCCGSGFNFEGNPINGPARRPLRKYFTSLSGSTLTITDEVLNGI